jgi:NAD(P)-dependent dehydrogenase (short-subunit alcohol dehydrogenase family)
VTRTAIVTGASKGIGFATALGFIEKGWRVISCARGPAPDAFSDEDLWIEHVSVDLINSEGLESFVNRVIDLLGADGLDALVNNAALSPKSDYLERLGCLNGDISGWKSVFELNFFVPLSLSRGFAGCLHKKKGAIVNITSIAGHTLHPFAGSAYATSKAALSALSREMANEFAELNIRVNAVAPGEISTGMIGPEYATLIPRIPLNRLGSAAEVASVVYRLCDQEFAYVTGSEVFVTGGQHLS